MVAANGEEEKTKWLEDLTTAINQAKTRPDNAFHYLSLKSISEFKIAFLSQAILWLQIILVVMDLQFMSN